MQYLKKEAIHTLLAILATLAVAMAVEVSTAESFDRAFLIGLAGVAARTLGTAVVIVLSPLALKVAGHESH